MATARRTRPVMPAVMDAGDLLVIQRSGLFAQEWFLARNPDLIRPGVDPLTHYARFGWKEGRWPNAYFDPAWYLARNRDVRDGGREPLLHYIEHGEAEGRAPIAWFDPDWYRATHRIPAGRLCLAHFLAHRCTGAVSPIPEFDAPYYLSRAPDVRAAGMDPFEHYLVQGASEDRDAAPGFDGAFYRERYLRYVPDANPLLHYRLHRHEPGVFPVRPAAVADIPGEVRRNTRPGPLFEDVAALPDDTPRRAKVLAFYLPQFHAVPENDGWWGRGFTEWTNVARGLPRFAGHYQPRIPRDLGHYRLEGTDTLRQQAAMARGAGVHGFVFYFYWFNGRRLLDAPLDALLADPSVDLPFCLMWANENWTRRWDGSEHEVLISQDYREADEPALAQELLRHFRDPRYIRIAGRPVLMVYRAGLIPAPAAAVARWRALFRAHDEDPLFVMAQSFDDRDPRRFGMDVAVEFPPHKITGVMAPVNARLQMLDHTATARVYDYDDIAAVTDLAPTPYPLIRTALPSWDNDARRQGAGMVLHGSTPAAYQAWLERLIEAAVAQPVGNEAIVCVNAWNEWAEGAYLEPDVHFGAAYLNATARAVAGVAQPA
ncbi:MAG: glycoside hydrolase family 99-like domain-containing protein, partial [Gemmatimonadaceae bacterium]|nr:glycoside hydrolase family 99-like domain-containing protein [Acetobacteraceae bacterium]